MCLVNAPQGRCSRQRHRLEECKRTHNTHVREPLHIKFITSAHHIKQARCPAKQERTERQSDKEIEQDRYTHYLQHTVTLTCPHILRAEYGCGHRYDLEYNEYYVDQLIDQAHRSHALIGITAQHECIGRTQCHDKQCVNENGQRQSGKQSGQFSVSHLLQKEEQCHAGHAYQHAYYLLEPDALLVKHGSRDKYQHGSERHQRRCNSGIGITHSHE